MPRRCNVTFCPSIVVVYGATDAYEVTPARDPNTPMMSPHAAGILTGRILVVASSTTRNSDVKLFVVAE